MAIVISGASGLLGHYLLREFADEDVVTIGRGVEADIVCDLTAAVPALPEGDAPDLVVHCVGTRDEADAAKVNLDATRNLLKALDAKPPRRLVSVSSFDVYAPDSGEEITEECVNWNDKEPGHSKALAEAEVTRWAQRHGVTLTIVRPAYMFGTGMRGEMARMFSEVIAGRYIRIRGEEGRLSIVCGYDVARAIRLLSEEGGTFNLSDGNPVSWGELAEAMSANAGKYHRPMTLPAAWASAARTWFGFLPVVRESLDAGRLGRRARRLTISNAKALEHGVEFFNTIDVIRRDADGYPYEG